MSKPKEIQQVLTEMKSYCKKKNFHFTDQQLSLMAEQCYWYFEARGWSGIKYWPAVAYKWVLSQADKQQKPQTFKAKPKSKTVRDIILEQEDDI